MFGIQNLDKLILDPVISLIMCFSLHGFSHKYGGLSIWIDSAKAKVNRQYNSFSNSAADSELLTYLVSHLLRCISESEKG